MEDLYGKNRAIRKNQHVTNADTPVSTVNNLMSTMWMVISLIVDFQI